MPAHTQDYIKLLYNGTMLNQKSIQTVSTSIFSQKFVKPLYDSYCFSNIPGTIDYLLSGSSDIPKLPNDTFTNKVSPKLVFFFIDSFGWQFFEKNQERYPFLKRFMDKGVVSKLTSQFPSTTAAHVTSIHTGQSVAESGIFEWYYYDPIVDDIISPLLYSIGRDKKRDSLTTPPEQILPTTTFYQTLAKKKIDSYIFQYRDYTPSIYSDTVFKGAKEVTPYRNLAHGLTLLAQKIYSTKQGYFFFYYDSLDGTGHLDGPGSPTHTAEIELLFTMLENLFYQKIDHNRDVAILLSADHGLANTPPKKTFYLNQELPELETKLMRNKKGQLLVPGGSCRDYFLYVKDSELVGVKKILEAKLKGIAEVFLTSTLIEEGIFGNKPLSKRLLERLGNLVILPFNGQGVFWYEEGVFEQVLSGHHGGLTPEEMEIPLLYLTT